MDEIILHVFIVAPLIRFLLKPDTKWNKKFYYSGAILSLIILICVSIFQLKTSELNYYEILGTHFGSSKSELQSAYHKLSLKHHPDKNHSLDSAGLYEKIKKAYEILSHDEKRQRYNRFGDFNKDGNVDESQFFDIIILMLIQCLIFIFFGCLYCIDRSAHGALGVFLSTVCLAVCSEYVLRFSDEADYLYSWIPYFSSLVPFEKIRVLNGLVPTILNASLLLCPTISQSKNIPVVYNEICKHLNSSNISLLKNAERIVKMMKAAIGPDELEKIVITDDQRIKDKVIWNNAAACFPNAEIPAGLILGDLYSYEKCLQDNITTSLIKERDNSQTAKHWEQSWINAFFYIAIVIFVLQYIIVQ